MPTQTFFNLPKKKQELLLKSARNEFTNTSFENASINQIIKEAGISRGSFYMYFHDKEDLYFYLLEQSKQFFEKELEHIVDETHGDLFLIFEKMFEKVICYCSKKNHYLFFKQVFTNINGRSEQRLFFVKENTTNNRLKRDEFLKKIDKSNLNIEEMEDLEEIVGLLLGMTLHTLIHSFHKNLDKEELIDSYHRKLNLLRYGMEKK